MTKGEISLQQFHGAKRNVASEMLEGWTQRKANMWRESAQPWLWKRYGLDGRRLRSRL